MDLQIRFFDKFKPKVSSPLRNEFFLTNEPHPQQEIAESLKREILKDLNDFEELLFRYRRLKHSVDLLNEKRYSIVQQIINLIKNLNSSFNAQSFTGPIKILPEKFSDLKKEFKAENTCRLQKEMENFKEKLTALNQEIIEDKLTWFIVEKVKGVIELLKKIKNYYDNAINPSDSITEDYHITLNLAYGIFTQSLTRRLARFNEVAEGIAQSQGFNEKNLQKVEAMNTEIAEYLGFCNELIQTFDIQGPHNLVQYEDSYAEIKSKLNLPTLLLKSESEIKPLLISPITPESSFFHLDKGEQTEKEYPTALPCSSPVVS